MKKTVIGVVSFLLILIVVALVLLFTPIGNSILKPVIESKINENLPKKISLKTFILTPSSIKTKILIEKGSFIDLSGNYSIFSKSFDINYDLRIKDLSKISSLVGMKIRGELNTKGRAKGDISNIIVDGFTDLAKSSTNYIVSIKNMKPSKIDADIKSLKLEKVLYMLYQPQFLKGDLDANIKLTDLNPNNLKGFLDISMKKGFIDRKIMKKDFNVTLPKTEIKLDAKAKLEKTEISYSAKILSNLAKIVSTGNINSNDMDINAKYFVLIKELGLLKPITKMDFRGPLKTTGLVKGNKKELNIKGDSDITGSNTDYKIVLKDFKPSRADIDINRAKLAKILYMINQPIYADADIDIKAKLDNLDVKNMEGEVVAKVDKGLTNPKVLYKEFNMTNAKIGFNAIQKIDIKKSIATTKIDIYSTVADANIKKAVFDINKNKLTSDFTLKVPNLDKLYFVTKKHLRGNIKVTGDIKKDKDLIIDAHSDTLGGKVDIKLVNDVITKKIRGVKVTELTDMLIYPRVFESTMDADINYNLKTKKGELKAKMLKGRILPNQMTFLLNQLAKFDITKEIYEITTVDSKIDNMVIYSDLDMKSRLTHITSKNAKIDMNKNRVDAKLNIEIKNRPVYVKIRGDINKPKVSVDAKALLREKIEKKLEKKVPKQYQEPLKQILKMF